MTGVNIVRWQNILFSLLLTTICLVLGWYSHQHYRQWDITAESRHSLTETSIAVLEMLDGPVNVLAVMGPEKNQRDAVEEIFQKFMRRKNDLYLKYLNPETNPSRTTELKADPAGEIILNYGQQEQRIRSLSERSLTDALQRLARPADRTVRFVTGHQERSPSAVTNSNYSDITSRLAAIGFNFETISLVSEPSVPQNTDLLVIAAPREKYFPGEVASVLNYISQGGNLLWLHEPGTKNIGLRALEIELGVSPLAGVIVDANAKLFNVDTPTFAVIDHHLSHPINDGFNSITLFPEAAGLDILPMQDSSVSPLVQTSKSSWTETGPIEGEVGFDAGTEEVAGPINLGITIERDRGQQKQRIAVLGDADFMANTWLGNGGNQAFTERLFNWLGTDDNMLQFTSNIAPDKQLNLSDNSLILLAVTFLIAIPLFMLILAFISFRKLRVG